MVCRPDYFTKLDLAGWRRYPTWAWYRFLPVTLITVVVALFIEWTRREGSPFQPGRVFSGWSRLLYIIATFDIIFGQAGSLRGTNVAATITLTHALIMAVLASAWLSTWLSYLSSLLGVVALVQWLASWAGPIEGLPVALAGLALGYGVTEHGLTWIRQNLLKQQPWPSNR